MCNCFTVKVFVSNFKVEKVKTWTTLSTFLRFFDMTLQKNVKNVFSNYDSNSIATEPIAFRYLIKPARVIDSN